MEECNDPLPSMINMMLVLPVLQFYQPLVRKEHLLNANKTNAIGLS